MKVFCSERPYDLQIQLSSLCSVRVGFAFREAIRHVEDGEFAVAQAGDLGPDGEINAARLVAISAPPGQSLPPFVQEGDVLLQSRGQSFRAGVAPACAKPIIASASLLVITPTPAVLPAYLALFLNDPATQAELRRRAAGATIANLKAGEVGQIEVLLPTLDDQETIIALGESLRQSSRIEARLAELRRIQLRALLEERAERNRER